ncbi:toprim domain-containing protein [Methylobacillus caricis]|uniref:toprim domain-containing protein n=1 Tax=Methylobacillus caricis TaxID=1971611 RepID=UPI001CFF653E|nr:toprim domain-containing protein [Methylobacillus caricis]MCB5187411.1 toprim domain-containing protein [Methylobacillus caricis]
MASIDELKQRVDLHDLADHLKLVRPGGSKGNYRSPHHKDEAPSLQIGTKAGPDKWRDYSGDSNASGTCVDLVMYVLRMDVADAIKYLHNYLGIPLDKPEKTERREKTRVEYIADQCYSDTSHVVEYLKGRGISEEVILKGLNKRTVGFNDYRSTKIEEGQPMHGGPAAAFIVKPLTGGPVVAVDMRYFDATMNGGVKTQCQGEKFGYGWALDPKALLKAHTVYLVESPINAMSIESCGMPGRAAFAIRGTGNASNIPLDWLKGKRVHICMDNDQPDNNGRRPGLATAWELHERLTAMDISAMMLDQSKWVDGNEKPINDVNDLLQEMGLEALTRLMRQLEPWLIQGQAGKREFSEGNQRVYLPYLDDNKYWRYRVTEDFTSYITEIKQGDDGESYTFGELCSFRVAGLSRVTIASATATMTGDEDTQPKVQFAVSVQTPRNGADLQRRVVEDEKLFNVDTWKRFGAVWKQSEFLRMINILERGAHIGSRKAANFVGLCYMDGKLKVNEGPDCYFTNPDQQCPYHNLTFPNGHQRDARTVIDAYQQTFKGNAALMALVWGLGGHLKVLLGFWPHMMMQADKGQGKSTLIKRLERSIGFTMFSGQSLQTEFRLLTSISHTSQPVGWEELSARRQDIIEKAVALLQENYQYTVNRRGADMTEFLISAPVLLAGEDVPVRSLTGKIVRTDLTGKKGPIMPDDLPSFPVRQWLEFLTGLNRKNVLAAYETLREHCLKQSMASGSDDGAVRMASNYAAVLTAWRYLCEFAEIPVTQGNFGADLLKDMNLHIKETSSDREPWIWIMETALSEIARGEFRYPHKFDYVDGEHCLLIRTSHVMDHLAQTPALREKWNGLPVKSDRVFKKQLQNAGAIFSDSLERTINSNRVSHLVALQLSKLAQFGLHAVTKVETDFNHVP